MSPSRSPKESVPPETGYSNDAVICAGSNIQPVRNMRAARKILAESFLLTGESGLLFTDPVGRAGQPRFLNAVYRIRTSLSRPELEKMLKGIESRLGRVRTGDRYAPRTIDLDLLAWNGEIVNPDVSERSFLRKLLEEIDFWVESRPGT